MSSYRDNKCIELKAALFSKTWMYANQLDGCLSTLFLTLPTFLQYSYNNFGGGDVPKDVWHVPSGRVNLLRVVFSR